MDKFEDRACIKCGHSAKPVYIEGHVGTTIDGRVLYPDVIEHITWLCKCGFEWETFPKDAPVPTDYDYLDTDNPAIA